MVRGNDDHIAGALGGEQPEKADGIEPAGDRSKDDG
jgi:hypothetical protein